MHRPVGDPLHADHPGQVVDGVAPVEVRGQRCGQVVADQLHVAGEGVQLGVVGAAGEVVQDGDLHALVE